MQTREKEDMGLLFFFNEDAVTCRGLVKLESLVIGFGLLLRGVGARDAATASNRLHIKATLCCFSTAKNMV